MTDDRGRLESELVEQIVVVEYEIPDIVDPLEMRQNLAAKEVDIFHRELVRHRSDMQQHHQITDSKFLDRFHQLLADGCRTTRDHELVIDEIFILPDRNLVHHVEQLRIQL